jgi:hypothetical protein
LLHPAIELPCDLIELGLRGRRQGVKAQRVGLRLAQVDAVGQGGVVGGGSDVLEAGSGVLEGRFGVLELGSRVLEGGLASWR